MSGFARRKRVNGLLDDKVKGRIIPDLVSSGREHGADADQDGVASLSLSDLVYGFLVNDVAALSTRDDSDSESDRSFYDSADAIEDLRKSVARSNEDSFRNLLYVHVMKAVEGFSCLESNKEALCRNVMAYLRNLGHNAEICKTKWESTGSLTAGSYEFIHILRSDSGGKITRYFVDLEFAMEFEIARPTAQYERLVQSVPRVFVGKAEELKRILKVVSDAARRSLKSRDLHIPPWRKHRYMQNKWLGPHRRSFSSFPTAPSPIFPTVHANQNFAVKCRSIGFDTTTVNSRLMFPVTTRTR